MHQIVVGDQIQQSLGQKEAGGHYSVVFHGQFALWGFLDLIGCFLKRRRKGYYVSEVREALLVDELRFSEVVLA